MLSLLPDWVSGRRYLDLGELFASTWKEDALSG
jgi:hypothetical protein